MLQAEVAVYLMAPRFPMIWEIVANLKAVAVETMHQIAKPPYANQADLSSQPLDLPEPLDLLALEQDSTQE